MDNINDIIKDNEYLIKFNIRKHFYNFSRTNGAYDDLIQEGYIALWKASSSFKDRGKDDFKYYADLCIRNRLITYVKNKNNELNDIYLADAINKDKDGNLMTLEDVIGTNDDISEFENKSDIMKYINKNKDTKNILQLLISGYNQKEISNKLNIEYRIVNNKVNAIKKDLIEILDVKIEKNKSDGKLVAIGEGFRKEFNSVKECSEFIKADYNSIRKICQKRKSRKSCYSKKLCKKLTFEWIE